MGRRDWIMFVVHNMIVHPILPIAVVMTASTNRTVRFIGEAVRSLHDRTVPTD